MKDYKFETIDGKTFKVETKKREINLEDIPKQIAWIESEIAKKQEAIDELNAEIKELKKIDV